MNPYLQDILHNITTRLAKLEEAQTKKEWVGLTDEEIDSIAVGDAHEILTFARAIEAKLKEKNDR
jgi:hypothetical protein